MENGGCGWLTTHGDCSHYTTKPVCFNPTDSQLFVTLSQCRRRRKKRGGSISSPFLSTSASTSISISLSISLSYSYSYSHGVCSLSLPLPLPLSLSLSLSLTLPLSLSPPRGTLLRGVFEVSSKCLRGVPITPAL